MAIILDWSFSVWESHLVVKLQLLDLSSVICSTFPNPKWVVTGQLPTQSESSLDNRVNSCCFSHILSNSVYHCHVSYIVLFTEEMADSASESDSSSIDGGPIMMPPSPITREQLQKRIESLQQQNRVLKVELDTYKLRVKALQEENRSLRQASVFIVSMLLHIGNKFPVRLYFVSAVQ